MHKLAQNRDQRGFTLIEVLVVVSMVAILAAVVVFAVGAVVARSHERACRMERRIIVTALQSSAASNDRGEFPPVAGPDGLDAVRADGYLAWEPKASHWRYDSPIMGRTITATHLVRTNTVAVAESKCPA